MKKPAFEALRRLRLKRGWTQDELAEKSGIDQATISALEVGRIKSPSFDSIARLAKALGADPEDLVPQQPQRSNDTVRRLHHLIAIDRARAVDLDAFVWLLRQGA